MEMSMHEATVILGFFAGALYIAAHYMKTMVPLRLTEIASNALFVVYGAMYPSWPTLALYGLLIPLNALRLYEMLELIKKVREAAQHDLSIDCRRRRSPGATSCSTRTNRRRRCSTS